MDWKRIGRAAMCFLVICCLLFNLSPIRAQAVVIESSLLFGVVAVAILTAAGVVFAPKTAEDVMALGDHMHSHLYSWGTSAEKLEEVDDFFDSLRLLNFGGSGDDVPDVSKNTKVTIARAILAGITAWVGTVILDGATKKEAEYSFGNYPSSFPALPEWDMEKYPYFFVTLRAPAGGSRYWRLIYSDAPVSYLGDYNEHWYFSPRPVSKFQQYTFSDVYFYSGEWHYEAENSFMYNSEVLDQSMYSENYGMYYSPSSAEHISYSNYTIYDLNGAIYFEGDDTNVSYVDVSYLPDLLLGDVAPGVSDGSLTTDDIVLPETLELGGLIHSSETTLKDIVNAQKELLENPDKYDLYLQQLTQPSSPSNPNPGTGTNPGTSTGSGTLSEMEPNTFFQKIASVFAPSGDYMTAKVDALREEFVFADSIAQTAKALVDGLKNVTTEPPMIYIDLGANTGPYDLGGKVLFLDLRWYADYKPTVDGIISAFLYACFVWKTYLRLPGILNGASGKFELSHRREQEDL